MRIFLLTTIHPTWPGRCHVCVLLCTSSLTWLKLGQCWSCSTVKANYLFSGVTGEQPDQSDQFSPVYLISCLCLQGFRAPDQRHPEVGEQQWGSTSPGGKCILSCCLFQSLSGSIFSCISNKRPALRRAAQLAQSTLVQFGVRLKHGSSRPLMRLLDL